MYRIDQRHGLNYVVDVLRGANTQKTRSRNHQNLTVFGIGKAISKPQWISIGNQLLHQGYLRQNIERNGALQLTEKARPLLTGKISIILTKVRKQLRKKKVFSVADSVLFEKLRAERNKIAFNKNIPPYFIFSDATLLDMCKKIPTTRYELLEVSGVGVYKMRKYGKPFMTILQKHMG